MESNDYLIETIKQHIKEDIVLVLKDYQTFFSKNEHIFFAIDSETYKFRYCICFKWVKYAHELCHKNLWSKEYFFEDIKGFEIINQGYTIEKKSSNFGKMVAGGLLFGGVGVLAGALDTGRKTKQVNKNDYIVRLLLNDLNNAMVDLHCQSSKEAYNLIHTLSLMEEKYYKENNKNTLQVKSVFENKTKKINYPDEIKNLVSLLEQGIINKEEFELMKNKIVNS